MVTRADRAAPGSACSTNARRTASETVPASSAAARRRDAATPPRWPPRSRPSPPRKDQRGALPSKRAVAVLALREFFALGLEELEARDDLRSRLRRVDDVVDEASL